MELLVVLGCALTPKGRLRRVGRLRVERAVEEYLREPRTIIFSGGRTGAHLSEAEAMARYAETLGVSDHHIIREEESQSTWENGTYCKPLLGDARRVTLVTSAFHCPRAERMLNMQWPDVEIRCAAAPDGLSAMRLAAAHAKERAHLALLDTLGERAAHLRRGRPIKPS